MRLAILLSVIGDVGIAKWNAFTFQSDEERENIDISLKKFEE